METRRQRPQLTLIAGEGPGMPGPVTRLGLWNRVAVPQGGRLALFAATKILLLTSVLYFLFG